ncbi:sel1 repeat family protein [Vibrio ponticus]|uniref:Sel1 repeat family protein n=1 Tax=Vibrio ponticus TaxID=265668 RepID=A0A3N3DUF1_9VIBR|nr:tetratricopeptide repeat protein [Vibrio ponticus]ROV58117.1 sel1 repeat family protein [Vibrio ponticus]
MSMMGIAIGATGLLLLLLFLWMFALSVRQKRVEEERKQRESAYRKAMARDRQRELEERIRKAEHGDITMILYLAKEEERTNLRKALYWYLKAAHLDNITGMYGIIRISDRMKDDVVLRQQAQYWRLAVSAAEGNLEAKYQVAEALFYGRGVEQNVDKAYKFMEDAAKSQYIPAMLFLGDWAVANNNPQPSPINSYEWFFHAAKLKDNEARLRLGVCYIEGIGVEADFQRGCYWLERAGEKGYTPAMLKAGEYWMEQGGQGKSIAYIWLFMAAQLGNEDARILRDQISLTISVDIVVGLQSLAKPMLKRIREKRVGKHAIIKALNRLYKRDFDYLAYDMAPETENVNLDEDLDAELPLEPSFNHFESPAEEMESQRPQATLDFSQSPMDQAKR